MCSEASQLKRIQYSLFGIANVLLLRPDCVSVYRLLLGFYGDDAFVVLFYLLCIIVLCMCCLSGVIKNINRT